MNVKCPTCDKLVEWTEENKLRPFCSERCKLIDLGDWADGSNKIPGETAINDNETSPGSSDKDF